MSLLVKRTDTAVRMLNHNLVIPLFPSMCCCQTLMTFSNSRSSHFLGFHLSPPSPSRFMWSNWNTIDNSWLSFAEYKLASYSLTPHGISPTVQFVYFLRTFRFSSCTYAWMFGLIEFSVCAHTAKHEGLRHTRL